MIGSGRDLNAEALVWDRELSVKLVDECRDYFYCICSLDWLE